MIYINLFQAIWHALDPLLFPYIFSSEGPHVHRELLEEIKQKVETLEDKYSKKLEEMGVRHGKFVKKHGNPGEAIIAVAEKEKANLIVTGCRGMGLLRRTFLGSVSDYVMHHAHCPVLVCRK